MCLQPASAEMVLVQELEQVRGAWTGGQQAVRGAMGAEASVGMRGRWALSWRTNACSRTSMPSCWKLGKGRRWVCRGRTVRRGVQRNRGQCYSSNSSSERGFLLSAAHLALLLVLIMLPLLERLRVPRSSALQTQHSSKHSSTRRSCHVYPLAGMAGGHCAHARALFGGTAAFTGCSAGLGWTTFVCCCRRASADA